MRWLLTCLLVAFEICRSGNGEASADKYIALSTEDSLNKHFSFFEAYCTTKPYLYYLYCVFHNHNLLASVARGMPIGTGANGGSSGPPTTSPSLKKKGATNTTSGSVVIEKSKEGKRLEKAKRKHAELAVVAAEAQVTKQLDDQYEELSKEIKRLEEKGEGVQKFKKALENKSEAGSDNAIGSESESD